jgi:hypothetical protein
MNLHAIVAPAISAVNPVVTCQLQVSTGYSTSASGQRVPIYAGAVSALVQVQSLTYDELRQLDALNIQGIRRKIYLSGTFNGLVRSQQKGGDLVTLPDGTIWLIVHVFEYWADWTSAAITLQNGS